MVISCTVVWIFYIFSRTISILCHISLNCPQMHKHPPTAYNLIYVNEDLNTCPSLGESSNTTLFYTKCPRAFRVISKCATRVFAHRHTDRHTQQKHSAAGRNWATASTACNQSATIILWNTNHQPGTCLRGGAHNREIVPFLFPPLLFRLTICSKDGKMQDLRKIRKSVTPQLNDRIEEKSKLSLTRIRTGK